MSKPKHTTFTGVFLKDTVHSTLLNIAGRSVGFFIPFFVAAWFGVSVGMDAFYIAFGVILFLSNIFFSTISSVIVPALAGMQSNRGEEEKFIGSLFVSSSALFVVVLAFCVFIWTGLGLAFPDIKSGFLTSIFVYILEMIPLGLFVVWGGIMEGIFFSRKVFHLPPLSLLIRSALIIACIFFMKDIFGIHAIGIGYIAGEGIRFLFLLIASRIRKLSAVVFGFHLSENFRIFLRTAIFQIIGITARAFLPVIDQVMASFIGREGSVSLLYYTDRLFNIPVIFLSSGLMVTLLSYWSSDYATIPEHSLRKDMNKVIRVVSVIGTLLTAAVVFLSGYFVPLIYGYGKMTAEDIDTIKSLLVLYFIGFTPAMASQIFARAFTVMGKTKYIMITALVLFVVNILGNLILIQFIGIYGIALSTSIVTCTGAAVQGVLFYRLTKIRMIKSYKFVK
ncbi:MAG: polysaccharide biosynthesis C-terminal domain-containing protein [Spirochaetales bacterium]|nr:polysaccharide biosynthesis C-terminal domain-containing protein [Spirochaetales bacterium]